MTSAEDEVATARAVIALVAAATVIVGCIVGLVTWGYFRERRIKDALAQQVAKIEQLQVRRGREREREKCLETYLERRASQHMWTQNLGTLFVASAATQREMNDKRRGTYAMATLDDLMKPYKKHLLQSAFDLQSRLNQQVKP